MIPKCVETADGARLSYQLRPGPGVPLVLSHPHSVDSRVFAPLLEHWDGAALVWDRRGYGASSPGAGGPSQEEDLACVLEAAGLERAVLLGLAAGGAVSVALAGLAPERVAGLVLVNSYLGQPGGFWFDATGEVAPQGDVAARELAPGFRDRPEGRRWQALAVERAARGAGEPPQRCHAELAALAGRDDVVLATGALDLMFTPAMLAHAGRLLPRARCHVLPGVAHAAPYEDPAGVADWLQGVLSPG